MDLGTINRKLAKEGSGGYLEHEEFAADVQLVFDNAMTYNGPVSGRKATLVIVPAIRSDFDLASSEPEQ